MAKKGNSGAKNLIPIKKGEVRNPYGAPKKEDRPWRPLSEDVKKLLDDMTDVVTKTVDGKTLVSQKTFREQILKKLITKAANGDLKAMEILFDRTEGKPMQAIQHSGDKENPVILIDFNANKQI